MNLVFFFKLTKIAEGGNWAGVAMERFSEVVGKPVVAAKGVNEEIVS